MTSTAWSRRRPAVDVGLIARMVQRAAEKDPPVAAANVVAAADRFARDPSEFAITETGR